MAIIIDTNCFANVFDKKSANHQEYKPVLDWIVSGKGLLVYGGSKYIAELKKSPKYLPIFRLLKEVNKVIIGNTENIDKIQAEIESVWKDENFDDPHLVAIVIDTKCRLICSEDKRSIPFVRNQKLYPKGFQAPSYYTGSRNKDLLCDNYIHDDIKPLHKLKKEGSSKVNKMLRD
ncbi:hypothetical protein [Bergeyella cardium]|uniref:hypothetical protein n=1 Tax=Bergeyella cardium TaxID=1585976 RepID=UPI000EA0E6A6|nr:hypothetical protein [Bergeyella cardium]